MELAVALLRYIFVGIVFVGGGYVAYVIGRLAWDKGRTPKTKDQA
jgi:phage shock protein PspC (stress-responsive transcriptional regulator)